jgi:hypothetical protein
VKLEALVFVGRLLPLLVRRRIGSRRAAARETGRTGAMLAAVDGRRPRPGHQRFLPNAQRRPGRAFDAAACRPTRHVKTLPVALALVAVLGACSSGPAWTWPQDDFAEQNVTPFDPNAIIDSTASLTDPYAMPDVDSVQAFLLQTPYGTESFLATYASNGVSAATAIWNASNAYQLNPLLFLVRAEIDQALLSETTYPSPAARVEYAFGCGCDETPSPEHPSPRCDPALAGFDKQVDCLARTMRGYLDSVCGASQATPGGWSVNATTTTLDGIPVTPYNEGTAALYQYAPLVLQDKQGGNWFFWNVYQLFANAAAYPGAFGSAWIGDPCCGDTACDYVGGTCAVNVPDGMCTASCSASSPCPSTPGRNSVCASLSGQGFCLFDCTADPCRPGYVCQTVAIEGGGTGLACLPASN